MKKYFASAEFKRLNVKRAKSRLKQHLLSKEKQKVKRKNIWNIEALDNSKNKKKRQRIRVSKNIFLFKATAYAPEDFRLLENVEGCLTFFRNIRSEEYLNQIKGVKFVIMSLEKVTEIDYGTISILTAISDDLKYKGIILRGDFPKKAECKQFIIDSGFLNHMVNEKNQKFPKSKKSDLIFFEKGCGVLSFEDNKKISALVKDVVNHLTGENKYSLSVKTIILEICGNSIEWASTENKQWLLGVKYETERVFFTVTDVGKGILETLYRKFTKRFFDTFKTDDEILKGAFNKKYGSSTKELNRNKGLPAVKTNFEQGTINNLRVLTNNVALQFGDDSNSKTFGKGSPRFKGTFYQWEMTKECLNKSIS